MQQSDFDHLAAAAISHLTGVQEVDTPQLGHVSFSSAANIRETLNVLRQEAALAAGQSTAGVFVVGYRSGLDPTGGG
jgi:hypothetical protein